MKLFLKYNFTVVEVKGFSSDKSNDKILNRIQRLNTHRHRQTSVSVCVCVYVCGCVCLCLCLHVCLCRCQVMQHNMQYMHILVCVVYLWSLQGYEGVRETENSKKKNLPPALKDVDSNMNKKNKKKKEEIVEELPSKNTSRAIFLWCFYWSIIHT